MRNPEGKNTELGSALAIISQHKVTGIWDFGSWETVKGYNCLEIRRSWMKERSSYKHAAYKELRIC